MPTAEIGEWAKWIVIILVAAITTYEKVKRWHYRKAGKDRRSPNPNLESKVIKLCTAFKQHEKLDKERCDDIKKELWHLREEQSRQGVSIGTLKGRINSR